MFRVLSLIVSAALGLQPTPMHLIASALPSAVAETREAVAPSEDDVPAYEVAGVRAMWVTAYSSTPEETDETPFITAANTHVRHGIVATNDLPFGTKLRIPDEFGNTVFTVEDRMHRRKENWVDVWMPEKEQALRFGIRREATIVILAEAGAH